MAIRRMGISNPEASTEALIFTSEAAYLTSVIISNKSTSTSAARVWVAPTGATSDQYGYILYDVDIPAGESLESHRFGISNGDRVYVQSNTNNLSFSLTGIYDSDASIDAHILETLNVHGIPNTANLVTISTTNSLSNRLIAIELGLGIFD
jgi:hypothetical protein